MKNTIVEETQPDSYGFQKTFPLNPFFKSESVERTHYIVMLSIKTLLNMVGIFFPFFFSFKH